MLTDAERARARKNTRSRNTAINLMCKDCIYDDNDDGTWRQQVGACTAEGCPLFNFRPQGRGGPPRTRTPLRCEKHPTYAAKRRPRSACQVCARMWAEAQGAFSSTRAE